MSLQARLKSIQFLGGLPVAWQKNPVVGPHWETGNAALLDGPDGSTRPAVYRINSRIEADVVLEIQGATTGTQVLLQGSLGTLTLQGTLSLANGLQTIRVSGILGNAIVRHAGDAVWLLLLPTPFLLGTTRLEVFSVFGPAPAFYASGVWCEALRLLNGRAGLSGSTSPPQAMATLTRFCHNDHSLQYDAQKGDNHYGVKKSGGEFDLSSFLIPTRFLVSCFDLTGALIVLGGALGIAANWLLEDEDFFITRTSLIGLGLCNSPFFLKEKTDAIVVPDDNPHRSRFSQHGFCESDQVIYDACLGSHEGTERRQVYLDVVVDTSNPKKLGRLLDTTINDSITTPIRKLV